MVGADDELSGLPQRRSPPAGRVTGGHQRIRCRFFRADRGSPPQILLADPAVIGSTGVEEFIRCATPIRGTHFCLGANLARLELRILFDELLRALPGIRLVPGSEPEFMPGYFTRTLRELWVEFSPSPS
jgi:cytochrome P450